MNDESKRGRLAAVVLQDVSLRVVYSAGKGGEQVYRPHTIQVSPEGLLLDWPAAPTELKRVRVEWSDNPFMPQTFRADCVVLHNQAGEVRVGFDGPAPTALSDWFTSASALMGRRVPNAAVKTSRLYTGATVVSASGLFCGALAILLPILAGDEIWVDWAAKALLLAMVASIAGFAWLRGLAGRAEVQAIGQGQA